MYLNFLSSLFTLCYFFLSFISEKCSIHVIVRVLRIYIIHVRVSVYVTSDLVYTCKSK